MKQGKIIQQTIKNHQQSKKTINRQFTVQKTRRKLTCLNNPRKQAGNRGKAYLTIPPSITPFSCREWLSKRIYGSKLFPVLPKTSSAPSPPPDRLT